MATIEEIRAKLVEEIVRSESSLFELKPENASRWDWTIKVRIANLNDEIRALDADSSTPFRFAASVKTRAYRRIVAMYCVLLPVQPPGDFASRLAPRHDSFGGSTCLVSEKHV